MLQVYLGNDDFQKGLNLYLNKFAYKNTYTEDLWDSLEEASKKPVRSIMSTWTKQKGKILLRINQFLFLIKLNFKIIIFNDFNRFSCYSCNFTPGW